MAPVCSAGPRRRETLLATQTFIEQLHAKAGDTLCAITVFFANELRQTNIKVNSVSPGYVATDLNDHTSFLTPQQGAALPVKFATLPADGPTGGFFEGNEAVPW